MHLQQLAPRHGLDGIGLKTRRNGYLRCEMRAHVLHVAIAQFPSESRYDRVAVALFAKLHQLHERIQRGLRGKRGYARQRGIAVCTMTGHARFGLAAASLRICSKSFDRHQKKRCPDRDKTPHFL